MDDYDLVVAERRRAALLEGVVLPTGGRRDVGWVLAVERLMSKGVGSPAYLADLLEQPVDWCRGWVAQVRDRWRTSIPSEVAGERREELYQRTMAIADMAMGSALGMSDQNGLKPRMMKTALDAYDKAGDLAGVKKVSVEVEHTVELRVRPAREVLEGFGLDRLKDLGSRAARGMRELGEGGREEIEEAEVLEAEVLEESG